MIRWKTAVLVIAIVGMPAWNCSSRAYAGTFTSVYTDGGVWNTVFAQGFSPAVVPNPDPMPPILLSDFVSLTQFQFFKSGNADTIGTPTGTAGVQLAILNNIFGDLTNLSTSSNLIVGLSTNVVDSTAGLATGAPITFSFNKLPVRYGTNYGALVVHKEDSGALTPVRISALTANYMETSPGSGMYVPVTNYGGTNNYPLSTSNFIQTNTFGQFLFGFSSGGDANFSATFNRVLKGDFNLDDHFNSDDVLAMERALTDLGAFQSMKNINNTELVTLGDFDSDQAVTNADLQQMLFAVQGGNGSLASVPEPASLVLAMLASLPLLATRTRRNRETGV